MKEMTLNEYQEKAMSTCLPACDNDMYMLTGLTAEIGEINDKVAKWVRKGIVRIDNNNLRFNTANPEEISAYVEELMKELGDVLWFVAGLSNTLCTDLNVVAQCNLDKLANRKNTGTIITHTDH